MQAIRPVLRRPPSLVLRSLRGQIRLAQDNYGPHKEYFQTPGQMPLPDTSPYVPPTQTNVPRQQNARGVVNTAPEPQTNTPRPSRIVRVLRSIFWAGLFGAFGITAGTALITWEYMQPPFQPGSEEEAELYEEIIQALETHPLIDELRHENWIEENFYLTRKAEGIASGFHLIQEKLTGTQGLVIKAFKHPVLHYTILVFFAGFGVEGWPDTIHGGVITSMLIESILRHVANYYKEFTATEKSSINVDFKAPLRPGEIYAILVPPAAIDDVPDNPNQKMLSMASFLMRMEAAPKLGSHFDATTNTETHTIDIRTGDGMDVTMAMARAEIVVSPTDMEKFLEHQKLKGNEDP